MVSIKRLVVRLRTANKKAHTYALSRILPYYVLNEFPKSGGTWLSEMVGDAMNLEFVRHNSIKIKSCVVHGHFLRPGTLANVSVLWRDPRDVLVSFYFHCYFQNDHNNGELIKLMKARRPFSDYNDLPANLPDFIRFVTKTPQAPNFSWVDFARNWAGRAGVVHGKYEDLRRDTQSELIRTVRELAGIDLSPEKAAEIADKYNFAKAKARAAERARDKPGVQMPFIREGSTGGWRKHFTPEALAAMEQCGYGAPMRQLGYKL